MKGKRIGISKYSWNQIRGTNLEGQHLSKASGYVGDQPRRPASMKGKRIGMGNYSWN